MNPPSAVKYSSDHCPVSDRVTVLETKESYTLKAFEKMEKEVSEIRDTVTRIERESLEMKKAIDDQGKEIGKLATLMEGKNGQTGAGKVSGLMAGGNLERVVALGVALGSGLAHSLGWSLLFLVLVGVINKPVALQIVQWVFKILGVNI